MKNLKIVQAYDLPGNPDADSVYELLPKDFSQSYYDERTDRNIGWITREEQEMLKNSVVGIAGCGGMGGLVAATLLRLGVGEIRIADIEVFDRSNLNRQFAASKNTIGKSKAFETAKILRDISDDTKIAVYPQGITEETADNFAESCDVICDEIEFWAVGSRILLHRAMREKGSLILNSPTVGHRVYVTKFTPASMKIEEILEIDYEEAKMLQAKIQKRTATKEEVIRVMEKMIRLAAPEIPEYSADLEKYSTVAEVRKRLFEEVRASIIATNPPMASGYLANQVLYHLLDKYSDIKRNFIIPVPMPGFLMIEAGFLKTENCKRIWWKTVVTPVSDADEMEKTLEYVKRKYKEKFGTTPGESGAYISAIKGNTVLGTVALDFPDASGKLPLEHIYQIERKIIKLALREDNVAQIGKWIADDPGLSLFLAYASSKYALSLGKKYGFVTHSDAVAEGDRKFYITPPLASPYIMDFEQIIQVLEAKISKSQAVTVL